MRERPETDVKMDPPVLFIRSAHHRPLNAVHGLIDPPYDTHLPIPSTGRDAIHAAVAAVTCYVETRQPRNQPIILIPRRWPVVTTNRPSSPTPLPFLNLIPPQTPTDTFGDDV